MKKYIGYIVAVIIGGILSSGITIVAYQMTAGNISYTPSNNKWKVNNVESAINDLHNMKTSDIYDTEEHVVGKWIDGKPLYQKTVNCGYLSNKSYTEISTGLSNVYQVLDIKGTILGGPTVYTISYAHDETASLSVWVTFEISTGKIKIYNRGSDRHDQYAYVTLQYTKNDN